MNKISFSQLHNLYIVKKKSVPEVAKILECSENKINYWLHKHKIQKRSISDAIYLKNNPNGDPFEFKPPKNLKEAKLFGLGLGLYWGEGTKADKNSVKLGNTDPILLKKFIEFLILFFSIRKKDLKFQLQIFTDINSMMAKKYWIDLLKVNKSQFYKTVITKNGSLGTYRNKSKYGVLTVFYHNTKLRNKLIELLPM